MKVSLSNFNYNYARNPIAKNNLSFGHHPDFDNIKSKRPICYSYYFRRDHISGIERGYYDLINVFRKVFTGDDGPKKMLVAGIANSEEPLSYLATIKQLNPDKPIENVVDLHVIDLQSKPNEKKLYGDSYILAIIPSYAKDSFVYKPHPEYALFEYRVNDEIYDFISKAYNDPNKAKWESRLQEATYPEEYFDIISVNNVLYYMPESKVLPTFNNLFKALKPGGYIITEDDKYAKNCENCFYLTRVAPGIHQKYSEPRLFNFQK